LRHDALRAGTSIPGHPGSWERHLAAALAGRACWPGNDPGHPAVEIAIYPDVIWLTARIFRTHRQRTSP
jgi:hypothetical protein